ncbi:MAG TPA: hypothetical protein VIL07_11170 [Symbiobacteriaceae bacterium]
MLQRRPVIGLPILLLLVLTAILVAAAAYHWLRVQSPGSPPEDATLVGLMPELGETHIQIALWHATPGVLHGTLTGSPSGGAHPPEARSVVWVSSRAPGIALPGYVAAGKAGAGRWVPAPC